MAQRRPAGPPSKDGSPQPALTDFIIGVQSRQRPNHAGVEILPDRALIRTQRMDRRPDAAPNPSPTPGPTRPHPPRGAP